MHKPKKTGIGHNKQFGPIQKLTVPDFQHISNQYEQMQNEILEKPNQKRKQPKSFSIRKATNPNQTKNNQASADMADESMKYGSGQTKDGQILQNNGEPSLLTQEENDALQPRDVKVENPWIYEQTHQEYLENIKGLPARHANVIKKHHDVQKETTFLHKAETGIDKDQATRDAVALLDKEYEIFNEGGVPGVKVLTRYDTWDEDRSIEQWIEYCQSKVGEAHALSPVYQGYEYCWKPVEVLDYDYKEKKYKVRVVATGQEKLVTRLSLLFFDEDPDKFKERVNQCKHRQEIVEAELRFTNLVDSVPTDSVSTLSKERRFYFLSKSVRESDKFDPDKIYGTFKHLLRVVEEEYIRQMKKCVILKEMEDTNNYDKFKRMKIPIRLTKKTSPYFGVVRCPKYNFSYNYDEIQNQHFSSDEDLVAMTRVFIQKCIDFQEQRFINTNKQMLKLPRELKDLEKIQSTHHSTVTQNIMIQWRDYLIGEIQDKLRKNHHFFEANKEIYKISPLKRIIARFDYILNTYLREFVKLSIYDYVNFIKDFTNPNLSNDELWRVNEVPYIVIHLGIQKKVKVDKKKELKKKEEKKEEKKIEEKPKPVVAGAEGVVTPAEGEAAAAAPVEVVEEEDENRNKVIYKPSIEECRSYVLNSMDMIIKSTNCVNDLESDLIPFIQQGGRPNFEINHEFPWVKDATERLSEMIDGNISGPTELINEYKKFEYVLNVDKKALIDDLFKGSEEGGKVHIDDIRKQIQHYEQAYYDIMTLSEDEVNFRIFRVVAKDFKHKLSEEANKLRNLILQETYKYCVETVKDVQRTYQMMQDSITHEPKDERELIDSKDFIARSPQMMEDQVNILKEVYIHYLMLDSFSYHYEEVDIDTYWFMRTWPLRIQACLTDGKNMMADKNDIFSAKLEQEKDAFQKQLVAFQQQFDKIKLFNNLANAVEFSTESFALKDQMLQAVEKKKQFNEREVLFGLPETPYEELDKLEKEFKPFYDLTTMAYDVECSFRDWRGNQLMRITDPASISNSVSAWYTQCFQLQKKLIEDYPETADVATELRGVIDVFSKNLPLIRCFTSEAITDEDWKEIQDAVGIASFDRDEIRISQITEFDLFRYVEEIEEITMKAEKKYSLAQKLKAMKDEMKVFQLQQTEYKGITFLIKGYEDINAKLDDQIVATQAMLGSSFMRGRLKNETRTYEKKLNDMSELMEEVLKVQRTWMYLEPIFGSGDIMNTMPLEGKMFNEVDATWKNTMKGIEEDPGIVDLAEKENIINQFIEANKKLDKIQKSLSDYLEQKRLIFARFFFLANDDLLQILAQTKNPRLVQAHMDKCFEGISKVVFNDEDNVLGMRSAEMEVVDFNKKIDVNEGDKKGNVENWMLEIESQMIESLKTLAIKSSGTYLATPRTEWSKMYPGQIVLASSQIYWTTEVETAIKDGELDSYIVKQQGQIEDIVLMVRQPLSDQERITLKALVVIDVHARDVVRRLIDIQISNIADFEWSSQLRYYWEDKNQLVVKMVTAEIPYAYEYLGNSPRLVITQLTDRCYRTLLGAKYLNYGGAPEGPAGTGKTESVKDLAKAIAVQCVVFNCSDGLDYLAMAKFFKGLAASGAWCCFDEFNRIDLEVLSVIAQQIQCIQQAIKNKKIKTFIFEKTELKINRSCAVNITMNPGYAGRSELPDNLKALFRPCAMMVPDYALIAQIELYSFGFSDAAPLSVKVVASLRLSSEQLSSQDHYDFGMRAVKSILTACGNQRRLLEGWAEDYICLKALNDVNIPKFTSNDIPLFNGITSDLFPGITLPSQDYAQLMIEMKNACTSNNLQPKDIFLEKCIQLYETIMVRHGLMVVGDPYAGKSSIILVLAEAMSNIKDDPKFVNVQRFFVNPKAITQNQLYGVFDMDTQEWSDGVLAIKVRDCAESETIDRKWIIFDGPVDAVWIENMNTVLDDNKKLCLNSGQIIKLKPTMTIMFQVDDLSQASPATISRCGMVLNESGQIGHNVYITSFCTELLKYFEKKIIQKHFSKYFHHIVDLSVEFTKVNCRFPCPGTGPFLVNHMIRLLDCFIAEYKPKHSDGAEIEIPADMEEKLINALIFATIWGIGGCLDEFTRASFDTFLQDLINGEDVREKYNIDMGPEGAELYPAMKIPNKIGDYKSLFDMSFDPQEMRWINWQMTVPKYIVDKDHTYLQLSIPTIDSIRMVGVIKMLLNNNMHALIVGPTGTGKSVQINQLLKSDYDNEQWAYYQLGFSAQTSANQTERIIDGSMEKKRKGVYGPGLGKEGVIFVDDLNMPQKEKYGAQPPIELLRQWMDYGGWYDIDLPEREFRKLINVRFCGAMGPPGNGRNSISSRYIRHFNTMYIEPYKEESLKFIFSTIMDWLFQNKSTPPYPVSVQGMKDSLVSTTIFIYKATVEKFKPTPAKSHYTFNLRDVSKIFQGISKSSAKAINTEDDMIKLWAHECLRVFQDRLISQADRDIFQDTLQKIMKEKFKKEWGNIVKVEPLLFASFVPLCFPDKDTTKKPFQDVYCELYDRAKVKKVSESALEDFNGVNHSKKMNLVLFVSAIEHVVKIHRVITTEFGHALLMGVGGSGRKSLTELATFIAVYDIMQIEISKAYDFNAWRDDMRQKLFLGCGVDEKQTVFLLNDTQIIKEAFLEDVNNILNNGEIPNLYSAQEDIVGIMDNMRDVNKNVPGFKNLSDPEIWLDFLQKCKSNIHIVLAMSPIGDDFKRRLRMFPSLVNCCAIDWFLEWPEQALRSVAEHFLKEIDDLPEVEGIVNICVDMQMRVTQLSQRYLMEQRRHYYVTPTSYLVLIQAFKELLAKKRLAIDTVITKYSRGIDQLANAKIEVEILKEKLIVLMPQLQKSKKETAEKIVMVDAQQKEVAEKTKEVEAEEAVAKEKKSVADTIQKDCEFELSRVMPIYNAAIRAVQQLKKDDITELKGFASPPAAAIIVVKTLCIMFYVNPKKVGTGKDKTEDYWDAGKKEVLTNDLLKKCQNYEKDKIAPELIEKLRPVIELPEYEDSVLQKASKAAWGLAKWVRAMVQYDDAMKVVKPKQAQLKEAKETSAAAQALWDSALEKLRAVETQMKALVDELDKAKAYEQQLTDQYDDSDKKCNRAKSLIEKLGDEEINWAVSLKKNREDKLNLVGDIIISSGVIAYLGVFTLEYRQDAIKNWIELMQSFQIQSSKKFSMREVLGNGVKIQQWLNKDGLPPEEFSIDNAIIMDNSERWPLMIDPQMQGNQWVKKMEKEREIKSIKPTMDLKVMSRVLENCISLGYPIILEDANETFDPMLEPLLGKQIDKKRNMWTIKLGDTNIEYQPEFKFYVTTKLSKPHFAPEVCVKVTMLNFMVTEEGLQDQMLNIVVTHEDPKNMERRNQITIQTAENERKKAQLEDKILNQIANSEVDILEDDVLLITLDESKSQCKQIEQQMKEAEVTMVHIENIRDQFVPVAFRVSRLFFVLVQIMNVDPMYQYSLTFFKMIYHRALGNGDHIEKSKRNERKIFFIKEFTRLLYENICRSLFEKDKLLFSFLILLKIQDEIPGNLDPKEVRFLMTGGTSVDMARSNPTGEEGWLTDKTWASVLQISTMFPEFKGLDVSFEQNNKEWERIYNLQKPQSKKANWPAPFNEMTLLRQAMLLRILRTDKVIPVIQKMIKKEKELGGPFIIPPPFDMEKSFSDSSNKVPIIIVLSAGADPMSELMKLAATMKQDKALQSVSLGQGQAQIAIDAIKHAQEAQQWVVLQNCHLCPSFLPTLDGIIEDVEYSPSSMFRIWMTSMPSDRFPVTILQNGVKATIEPPKGLKNNILRSYLGVDQNDFESCEKPAAYKSLLWGLCFFNALILERRKFGPLGWNIQYEFSNSDLSISQAQLMMFLNHYDKIPWDALRYMVAEANYGGRVTDPNDRVTIMLILEDFYCPEMLKTNHKLSESGKYIVPTVGDLDSYKDYIQEQMPLNDLTEIFGLHENGEITSSIGITNVMLEVALSLQGPTKSGGGGLSRDDMLKEIAGDILSKLPPNFDILEASKKHPIKYEDSMNTVLQQELLRFNKLTTVVRQSLINVGKAIKGEVPLSHELEEVCNALFVNQVPEVWHKKAYPSLKPLASWILNFLERLNMMSKWVEEGAPESFWISGFFFTQSFLTGTKQNFARKHVIAIDHIDFDFIVISDETKYDLTKAPEDGVYVFGLFVEGARWDDKKEAIEESNPKVLFTSMKSIWILPGNVADIDYGHSYKCPVYKTARRAGTLSTTGHSTNFVLYLYLPIQKKHKDKHWVKRGVAILTQLSD